MQATGGLMSVLLRYRLASRLSAMPRLAEELHRVKLTAAI